MLSTKTFNYAIASYGYMKRDYFLHITTTDFHPMIWSKIQEVHGGLIVEKGAFEDPTKVKDIALAVEQMNRAGQYYVGLIEKILSE